MRPALLLAILLACVPAWAQQDGGPAPRPGPSPGPNQNPIPPAAGGSESCPGILTAPPDLSGCETQAAGAAEKDLYYLILIRCGLETIEEYQHKQQACLQKGFEKRFRQILYPDALKDLGKTEALVQVADWIQRLKTLKEEVEGLSCGWRFTQRTDALHGIYLKPAKFCRDSFQAIWGSHEAFPDAGIQEFIDKRSTVTYNQIQERTAGPSAGQVRNGKADAGPEFTWQRIAEESARDLALKTRTPGEAVRYAAQLNADRLRVAVSTIGLRAKALETEQVARDYQAFKRAQERALATFYLAQLAQMDPSRLSKAVEGR